MIVCVCVCVLSHWVHAAIFEVPHLLSLKCSSHWSLGLFPASVRGWVIVVILSRNSVCKLIVSCNRNSTGTCLEYSATAIIEHLVKWHTLRLSDCPNHSRQFLQWHCHESGRGHSLASCTTRWLSNHTLLLTSSAYSDHSKPRLIKSDLPESLKNTSLVFLSKTLVFLQLDQLRRIYLSQPWSNPTQPNIIFCCDIFMIHLLSCAGSYKHHASLAGTRGCVRSTGPHRASPRCYENCGEVCAPDVCLSALLH